MPTLQIREPMPVAAERVWQVLTDWASQGDWMLATTVRPIGQQRRAAGDRLEAFTGLRPIGFTDTMVVTDWQEGSSVTVAHTGRVVRGTGEFRVEPGGPQRSTVVWREDLDVSGGRLGLLGWHLAAPVNRWAVQWSLRRLARRLGVR